MSFIRAARRHGLTVAAVLAVVALGLPGRAAHAQIGSDRYSAIVVDARTGSTLFAANADEARHPASLTKMMTLYMVFEALRDGRLSLSTPLPVSADAASRPPSKLGLPPGSSITVEQAILALVTKSANDVAAAIGEHLGGGSESRFAQMMTLRARALGMTRTTFRNASGLPDPDQVTTARDMALLGRRLMHDFPDRFAYFSTPLFAFRGRTLWNHNRLLQEYEGTDGIKTGYVHDSGFNLVASAQRDGVRLIAAVFGGSTGRERDRHIMALLDQGFERMGVAPRERGSNSVIAGRMPQTIGAARAATLRTAAARREAREQRNGRAAVRAVATTRGSGTTRASQAAAAAVATPASGRARRAALRSGNGHGRAAAVAPAAAGRGAPAATSRGRRGATHAATTPRRIEQGDTSSRSAAPAASRTRPNQDRAGTTSQTRSRRSR